MQSSHPEHVDALAALAHGLGLEELLLPWPVAAIEEHQEALLLTQPVQIAGELIDALLKGPVTPSDLQLHGVPHPAPAHQQVGPPRPERELTLDRAATVD